MLPTRSVARLLPFAHLLETLGLDGPGLVALALPEDRSDLHVAVEPQDLAADAAGVQLEQLDQRARLKFLYVCVDAHLLKLHPRREIARPPGPPARASGATDSSNVTAMVYMSAPMGCTDSERAL